MTETQILKHNYAVYISVWFIITVFILWFFRFMSGKMKNTDDNQTKSSLFTITIIFGIPLLIAAVIGPMFFLIGDKNMESTYRYLWIALIGAFVIYFIFKQRSKK